MKPDTWMPLYPGDYLRDTMHLDAEGHGAYMLLILAYWSNGGPIPSNEDWLRNVCRVREQSWMRVKGMVLPFFVEEAGKLRHKRIDDELANAESITEARSRAGRIGSDTRYGKRIANAQQTHSTAIANAQQTHTPSPSPSPSTHSEDLDGSEKPFPEYPSLDLVKSKASMMGLAEWRAVDWFNEMEGCGWKDFAGRPIGKWEAVLLRIKSKWDADGRPSGPPASKYQSKPAAASQGPSLTELNAYARNKFSHPKLAQWVASFAQFWARKDWKQNGRAVEWQEALTKQVKLWIEKENAE